MQSDISEKKQKGQNHPIQKMERSFISVIDAVSKRQKPLKSLLIHKQVQNTP